MQIEGCRCVLEPVEPRSRISSAATVMARSRGLLEDYGSQHEEAF